MAHNVFISYSIKDKPIADAICAHLEAAGTRCWIAPRDITPGEDWPTAITRAISQSQVLVLVFSAASNASDDVSRELFLAANHKLVILPFKIENIEPEPGKQYYLARTHWLDALNPPTQEQIQNLVQRVKTLVPLKGAAIPENQTQMTSSLAPALPAQEEKPAFNKHRGWLIPIGIILSGLLGWVAFSLVWKRPAASLPPTQAPGFTATLPATFTPSIVATLSQTILPAATGTTTAGTSVPEFTKVFISEPYNDNTLDWPVGNSTGPDWQGSLAIVNGVLDWQGNSLARMNALIHPGKSGLQQDLTDQEISVRISTSDQDSKGIYGLYLRASQDGSHFYAFYLNSDPDDIYDFIFYVMNGENHWKNLVNFTKSPSVTKAGWVKMAVQAQGSHFRLFVNDLLLTELDDTSLSGGQSGLLLTSYVADKKIQVQFDDYEILLPSP